MFPTTLVAPTKKIPACTRYPTGSAGRIRKTASLLPYGPP